MCEQGLYLFELHMWNWEEIAPASMRNVGAIHFLFIQCISIICFIFHLFPNYSIIQLFAVFFLRHLFWNHSNGCGLDSFSCSVLISFWHCNSEQAVNHHYPQTTHDRWQRFPNFILIEIVRHSRWCFVSLVFFFVNSAWIVCIRFVF